MEYVEIINRVGFPIAVTVYVLFRLERKINMLICVIHEEPRNTTNHCEMHVYGKQKRK
ncbi:hypothetical protein J2S78_000135 [Salibacterium salarium]|nr:hypothetical protein [Salibacterium salarium]